MAVLAVLPASRVALAGPSSDMTSGEPGWLAWTGTHLAFGQHALPASIGLAVALTIVAAAVFLPARGTRTVLVLALALTLALGLAQGLGGIFSGTATDPNSAPLLALLTPSYWPLRARAGTRA